MKTKIINLYYFFIFFFHNKKVFSQKKEFTKTIILIEFNNFCSNHVALSYFSNILKKKYNAKIVAYYGHTLLSYPLKVSFISKFLRNILKFLNWKFFGVYKSFGTENFFHPYDKNYLIDIKKINLEYKNFLAKIKNLNDLQNYKINDIKIGDLLYDTFLKSHYDLKPTITLEDDKFKLFVKDFINLFFTWCKYFKKNNVKAIVGSHAVYSLALPLRIASKNNIKSFVLSPEYLFKIKKSNYHQNYECRYLKKIYNSLDKKKQKEIKKIAENQINNRLLGKYSSDYPYITKSPFDNKNKNLYKKYFNNNKKKFLITTHDFVDAPHAMGNSLFEDFYIWLKFLLKNSNDKRVKWYIKTHPNFGSDWSIYLKHERSVVKKLCQNYKNVILLPQYITHNQLAKNKINAVFTVNGTVGLDYALLNIPVVNASLNNPHINFSFNSHPKTAKQLLNIIKNFKFKKTFLREDIYIFYAIKNIFFSKNWFFSNFENTIQSVGSYHNLWKPLFYFYWTKKEFPYLNNLEIEKRLKKFILSNDNYCLFNNNLGKF